MDGQGLRCPYCGESVSTDHPIYDVKDVSEFEKGADLKVFHAKKGDKKFVTVYVCNRLNLVFTVSVPMIEGPRIVTFSSSLPPEPHFVSIPVPGDSPSPISK